jgi:phage terminase large subunit GpA-like protein
VSQEIRRFFRHCPSCGRRFEIRLESKSLVSESTASGEEESPQPTAMQDQVAPGPGPILSSGSTSLYPSGYAVLNESKQPTIIDTKEFRYAYRCHHCGHMWSELQTEESSKPVSRTS